MTNYQEALAVQGYGSRFITETFGIPNSALHYWDRTNLLKPSIRPASGKGTRRLYSFRDLVQLLVVARLSRQMGLPLQRIRKCLRFLRREFPQLEAPLAEVTLLTDGDSIFIVTADPDQVLDTLREQVVWSVPLGAILRSTRKAVAEATTPRTESITVAGRVFTVTFEQDPEDGWWVGLVRELPGCGSQGADLDEARAMVADAIAEYLLATDQVTEAELAANARQAN